MVDWIHLIMGDGLYIRMNSFPLLQLEKTKVQILQIHGYTFSFNVTDRWAALKAK